MASVIHKQLRPTYENILELKKNKNQTQLYYMAQAAYQKPFKSYSQCCSHPKWRAHHLYESLFFHRLENLVHIQWWLSVQVCRTWRSHSSDGNAADGGWQDRVKYCQSGRSDHGSRSEGDLFQMMKKKRWKIVLFISASNEWIILLDSIY